jgi:DNA-binding HxlR family transcriptional regulator
MTVKRIEKSPLEKLIVLICGRWKLVILSLLLAEDKPIRFTLIRERIPAISQKILTRQLRELERDGIVRREMFSEVPIRVEYSLTSFGKKLGPILRVLNSWAHKYIAHEDKRAKTHATS